MSSGTWPPKVMASELACCGMMSCVMWAMVADGLTYSLGASGSRERAFMHPKYSDPAAFSMHSYVPAEQVSTQNPFPDRV